jgi:hypothetical protein
MRPSTGSKGARSSGYKRAEVGGCDFDQFPYVRIQRRGEGSIELQSGQIGSRYETAHAVSNEVKLRDIGAIIVGYQAERLT